MILTTIAIVTAIAGIGAIACLSLSKVTDWLRSRNATRYGDLIKREMSNGNVEIIAIGITANGTRTGEKTWTAKSLDSVLAETFGYRQKVRITV
jgi:hypothetical protein